VLKTMAVLLLVLMCGGLWSAPVAAAPWAAPGDIRLRHDLQLLGDARLLNIPLTTWPMSLGDVSHALDTPASDAGPAVMAAYRRVEARLRGEGDHKIKLNAGVAAAGTPIRFRSFADTSRETLEGKIGLDWMTDSLTLHLQGTVVRDPADGKQYRPDGSYIGAAPGNWMVSAGWMDRWWGPGWEGSLIMSSNARPVPAIAIQRNYSDAFDVPVLRWLGPWQFRAFQGKLEGGRVVPDALLTGMRLSFKPTPGFEFSLSRTIQWGGRGRPHSLATFLRALAGQDNTGQRGVTFANQPGNQLAGYDARWTSPLFDLPYAIYTQWIGEDESHGFPIQYMAIIGGEVWGTVGDAGASWRLHAEYADTAAHLLGGSLTNRNAAYEHSVYRSGYRFYNRSLGHSIDGDGLSFSLGGVLVDSAGRSWEVILRNIRTNRDGTSPGPVRIPAERILAMEGRGTFDTSLGQFQIGTSLYRSRFNALPGTTYRASAELQWNYQY